MTFRPSRPTWLRLRPSAPGPRHCEFTLGDFMWLTVFSLSKISFMAALVCCLSALQDRQTKENSKVSGGAFSVGLGGLPAGDLQQCGPCKFLRACALPGCP